MNIEYAGDPLRGLLCLGAVLLFLLTGCHGVERTPPSPTMPVPTWRGIVPGVSTEDDVVQILGEPREKEESADGRTYYLYPAPPGMWGSKFTNYIIFQDGRVLLILSHTEKGFEPGLPLFLERYGEPEKVTWANTTIPYTRLFIFARHGVAVVAYYLFDSPVFEEWYFVPTTLEHFLNEVAAPYLFDRNPHPGDRSPGDRSPEDYWVREGEDA